MQRFFCLMLVSVAALFPSRLCQDSCRVQDGKPGEKGFPGRDGLPGQKGEKGEPSYFDVAGMVRGPKGDQGNKGEPGEIGIKGYQGDLGPQGLPGSPGPKGSHSGGSNIPQNQQSGFSVTSSNDTPLNFNKVLTFSNSAVNINQDFDIGQGKFTCKVPGIYYFVFHAQSQQTICVSLKRSTPDDSVSFCDYNPRQSRQVASGGTVLKLKRNDQVWLELFKGHREQNPTPKVMSYVFNGFLVSPMA